MSRTYTDAEMLLATQIAYLNCDTVDSNATLDQIIDSMVRQYGGRDDLDSKEKKQWEVVQHIRHMMAEYGLEHAGQWRIVSTDNHRSSGMYGCLIDTADGNAIIGFRGSESYNAEQAVKDWGIADLGLLNNQGETEQQKEAERYMREIAEQYGDKYDHFGVTGHSLGGNLATHATLTAPDSINDKLECVSFDGPGFSDEYIKKHEDDIARNADKITHYQWSFVGGLLVPIPGAQDIVIRANNPEGYIDPFTRHDTNCVVLDEDGNVIPGPREEVATALHITSLIAELIDSSPITVAVPVITLLVCLAGALGRDLVQNAVEKVKRFWRDTFGHSVRGEYEIEPAALVRGAKQYDQKSMRLDAIADEVRSIERSLQYDSMSGAYIKSKLWGISNSVHTDGKNARKIEDALYKVQELYYDTDVKVEDRFYGL